jgi:phage terminase small subunit
LPDIEDIDTDKRNLIIIEDLEYKTMSREQRALLDRYFGCYSTHCNVSLYLTAQDAISIPATIRRMASHVFIWKSNDINHMAILSSRFGLTPKDLSYIFKNLLTSPHDSLLIDSTRPTCRYRKNIFEIIPWKDNA